MRFLSVAIAVFGIYVVVESLPKSVSDSNRDDIYLDLIKEIEDAVETKRQNGPADISSDHETIAREQSEHKQAKAIQQKSNDPPYTEAERSYIAIAREVADAFMEERTKQRSRKEGAGTAREALRSFNRPSLKIRQMIYKQEKENAELQTLLLLATGDNKDMLREVDVDLTRRAAQADPSCNIVIDCSVTTNRTFVDGIEFRNIDGICNNQNNYTWGMTYVQHRRLLNNTYNNDKWHLRQLSVTSTRRPRNDVRLPSARNISNVVHSNSSLPKPDNNDNVSLALFYFMQFIDHDLALTPEGEVSNTKNCCAEDVDKPTGFCLPIKAEVAESYFSANYCMDSRRSFTLFRCNDSTLFQNQINSVTSYLDASMIYGSTHEEEDILRTKTGGWLVESSNRFLPNASDASDLPCNVTDPNFGYCYETGDVRANVHPGLATYHTIFVRQHNQIATKFAEIRPQWSDERIFQETRKIIGALIQRIVYNEMLPVLFRQAELDLYGVSSTYSYNSSIDASMTQAFSMAYGYHNLMPHLMHMAEEVASESNPVQNVVEVNQENVFQRPHYLIKNHYKGIDELALGLVVSKCPYVNRIMSNASRNLLFLDAKGDSFDLVALNIMRGREWGMPTYTSYREYCGLGAATTWSDLLNTTLQEDIHKMASVYADVRDVDPWTGFVTEQKLPGSISGPTQTCLVAKHFANLKHGDRFWYESGTFGFTNTQLQQVQTKTLARVLCDNLGVSKMRQEVFRTNSDWVSCGEVRTSTGGDWDLTSW